MQNPYFVTLVKPSISDSSDPSVFTILLPSLFGPYVNFPNLEYLTGLQNFH